MNYLILGWADLYKGSLEGGGYNLVALEHAKSLVNSEHNVYYIKSGVDFSFLNIFLNSKREFIKKTGNNFGINCNTLYDSKHAAPGIFNYSNWFDYSDDRQNKIILDFITKNNINSIFFHSHEGFNLSLIPFIKKNTNCTISVFCHDHFYVCPQVNLIHSRNEICTDNNNGKKCHTCLPIGFGKNYKKNRCINNSLFSWTLKLKNKISHTNFTNSQLIKCSDNNTLFTNIGMKDKRRLTIAKMLNSTDNVYSPSKFIIETLLKIGVNPSILKYTKLGLPHLDRLKESTYKTSSEKIRFCFRGTEKNIKGVHILLEAIKFIDRKLYNSLSFDIYGVSNTFINKFNLPLGITINIYGHYHIPDIIDHQDYDYGILCHLWYENSPIVMLEHLSLGKAILTPKLGGVVDYISEGKNGFFYEAGNSVSLSSIISELVKKKIPKPSINKNIVHSFSKFIKDIS